jgi:transposase
VFAHIAHPLRPLRFVFSLGCVILIDFEIVFLKFFIIFFLLFLFFCIFAAEYQMNMKRKIAIKTYQQGQCVIFPEAIDTYISENDPVRLVNSIVEQLDLGAIMESYSGGGCSCYNPRMMVKVLFYAYFNNVYSCRKIEKAMRENIHYMWLSGKQFPKFTTINNFRSQHLKDSINELFTQVVKMLVDMGYLTLKEQFIDGTFIESKANRYTFVWKKSVEKNKEKLEMKIGNILQEIEKGIASDNTPDDEPPVPINSEALRKHIANINKELHNKEQQKQIKQIEHKLLPKLEEYEQKLRTCGERNSYSKTDPDATFMRLKGAEDAKPRPAYNLQIATEKQFITNFDLYQYRNDTRALKPLLSLNQSRYNRMPESVVADAIYGTEENYTFMEDNEIKAFVKYNLFYKEQQPKNKNNPFSINNLKYNEKENYFICPNGERLNFTKKINRISESGFISEHHIYQCSNCIGCHLREQCHTSKENRNIEVNHKLLNYKRKIVKLLTSKDGKAYYKRRSIEPEPVFGQMKYNKHYARFRHFGIDKITIDFAIFAIGHNIGKLWKIINKCNKNTKNYAKKLIIMLIWTLMEKKSNQTRKKSLPKIKLEKIAA